MAPTMRLDFELETTETLCVEQQETSGTISSFLLYLMWKLKFQVISPEQVQQCSA